MSMIECTNCQEINTVSMVNCMKCGTDLITKIKTHKICKDCLGYKKCYYNELYEYTRIFCLEKDKIFWEKGE